MKIKQLRRNGHMRIINTYRALTFALVTLIFTFGGTAQAELYNLSADWSDTTNPNGVWSYYVLGGLGISGTRGGDTFTSTPGPPPIWTASGQPNWLGWSKSNESELFDISGELLTGDIYGHTPGSGNLEIRWTSPLAGPAEVSGGVWAIRDNGRSNNWEVSLNGSVMASGSVGSGDSYDRNNPFPINLMFDVEVGDVVAFTTWKQSSTPDYIAIDLGICAAEVTRINCSSRTSGFISLASSRVSFDSDSRMMSCSSTPSS